MKKNKIKKREYPVYENIAIEGESIEQKVARIVQNKEPIKDGAPEIYTDRKDGVLPAYNIRTDRWDVALMAMDTIHKAEAAKTAKRDGKPEVGQQAEPIQQPTGDA